MGGRVRFLHPGTSAADRERWRADQRQGTSSGDVLTDLPEGFPLPCGLYRASPDQLTGAPMGGKLRRSGTADRSSGRFPHGSGRADPDS